MRAGNRGQKSFKSCFILVSIYSGAISQRFEVQPDLADLHIDELLWIENQWIRSLFVDRNFELPNDFSDRCFRLHQGESLTETDTRTVAERQQNSFVLEGFDATVLGIEALRDELLWFRIEFRVALDRVDRDHDTVADFHLVFLALDAFELDCFSAFSLHGSCWRMKTQRLVEDLIQVLVVDQLVVDEFAVGIVEFLDRQTKFFLDILVVGELKVSKVT